VINVELPKRKPNRLKEYDYSSNGYYFVMLCVKNKQKILWDIVEDVEGAVLYKCKNTSGGIGV